MREANSRVCVPTVGLCCHLVVTLGNDTSVQVSRKSGWFQWNVNDFGGQWYLEVHLKTSKFQGCPVTLWLAFRLRAKEPLIRLTWRLSELALQHSSISLWQVEGVLEIRLSLLCCSFLKQRGGKIYTEFCTRRCRKKGKVKYQRYRCMYCCFLNFAWTSFSIFGSSHMCKPCTFPVSASDLCIEGWRIVYQELVVSIFSVIPVRLSCNLYGGSFWSFCRSLFRKCWTTELSLAQ